MSLDEIIEQFQSLEPEWRLQLLLDYSEKLPSLPEKYHSAKDAELNRVDECQTPVFIYAEIDEGRVSIYADVAEEAPTVKGFVSILVEGLNGANVADVQQIPADLLSKLGIDSQIGMMRTRGLTGVISHVKSVVAREFSKN